MKNHALDGPTAFRRHLRDLRENGDPEVHERVDLRAWTALAVGGPADLLIRCRSADGLQRVIDLLAAHGRGWLVLGAGTRLVPPNEGLRVPVINLAGQLALWELDLDGAVAGGGANLAQVSHAAARTGIPGLERLMAEAGSVGGAVHSYGDGRQVLDGLVDWLELARPGAAVERIDMTRFTTGKGAPAASMARRVIVRARLQLSSPTARSGRAAAVRRRPARLPRTSGPAFTAVGTTPPEELLARADCDGLTVGGVRLSRREPNSIQTARSSRACDVARLVRLVQQRVAQRTGGEVTTVLRFVDEDGRPFDP